MKAAWTMVLVAGLVSAAGAGAAGQQTAQQEKPVPSDSIRITIPGCSRGTAFTVMESPEHESRASLPPGRRFRLSGSRTIMREIRDAEGQMIEITGLIRKGQLDQSGVAIGDNARISPGPTPGSSVRSNPNFTQVILDVEGWRPLAGDCPK
jgi:hypothetical protein